MPRRGRRRRRSTRAEASRSSIVPVVSTDSRDSATGAPALADAGLRVVVIGAGAVGSFLGGTLASAGMDVTLLARRPWDGPGDPGQLVLEGPDGGRATVSVCRILDPDAVPPPDLIVAAVKIFDLADALATAARWPAVPLLTVQNGIGAEAEAAAARSSAILAGSLTTAVEPIPGGARRRRTGGIGIAVARGDAMAHALAASLVDAWTSAGLPGLLCPDAEAMKWSKLLGNLVGNATSAILDMDPGQIYADPRTYSIERRQVHEAVAVMRAMGHRPITLPGANVTLLLRGLALPEILGRPIVSRSIAGARGGKSPSLRLHVRGGDTGPTEARWLNGAVADAGARNGVPTPVNAFLAAVTDEVAADPERAAWFAGRPDRLADALAAR